MNQVAASWNPSHCISASWLRKLACVLALTPLLSTRAIAQTEPFDHRWNGVIFDAFTFDGNEFWTVEDGGRIRHRTAEGVVQFQNVPFEVKDTLRRIHFVLDDTPADGPTGWAVGEMGWILKTTNGGTTWSTLGSQMPAALPPGTPPNYPLHESLWDVHFLSQNRGWLSGLHGIWRTVDGGANWSPCTIKMQDDHVISDATKGVLDPALLEHIEFYSLDLIERPSPAGGHATELIGMAAAEPGLVFKTIDGIEWKVVLDIRCLCEQVMPGCSTPPVPCTACYDCSTTLLPQIDGCLMQPANRNCEKSICYDEAGHFEAWDIDISGHPTQKLAVMVGGIGHQCGMVFTSINDGYSWKKEPHECDQGSPLGRNCKNDPAYNDIPQPAPPIPPNHPWYSRVFRQSTFGALYGVAIFDRDNSAILAGYGGLHAYRAPSVPIWRDVSEYNGRVCDVPNAVTMPLMGATAAPGNLTMGKAFLVGMGGFIREKDVGGTGWGDAAGTLHGSPWRIRDLHFTTDRIGFQVGQFCRIAKTEDFGATWSHDMGPPIDGRPTLKAVTFVPAGVMFGGQKGVTVGGIPSGGSKPAIYRQLNSGNSPWLQTDTATGFAMGPGGVAAGLLDVAFAGITTTSPQSADYWTAGEKGFMLHSRDDGETWTQFIPSSGQPTNFSINAVAFKDIATGIFAGHAPGSGGNTTGRAFQWKRTGNPVWSDLTPLPTDNVVEISDVVIAADTAYAVGEKKVSGVRSGVVLTSAYSNGAFGRFTVLLPDPPTGFPLCLTNEPANDLMDIPVLTEAEIHPTTGELWVGGQCGRVWKRTSNPVEWTELKSQTDTHILGISFGVNGSSGSVMGYFGGHRDEFPQACVVRYR